ncbi:DUF6509 family protein [Bacillus massilinigeriensis]|uniref:DUF6509 family protein n=1 Tax=Bacillus massilionigeriensis TaxID=1805475 RepID=UPI00096B38F7|nr:DUF6509 family protein [Bacillus massilionigeriensis]
MIHLNITGHSVEKIEDPFGILSGERYEFYLQVEVPEDDELFSEFGLKVRVLYIMDEKGMRISNYHIIENNTDKVLDFELEEDEELLIDNYCRQNIPNEEE